MTPRDVINRLTPTECGEIAAICLERIPPEAVVDCLLSALTEDELLEVGLRLKRAIVPETDSPAGT